MHCIARVATVPDFTHSICMRLAKCSFQTIERSQHVSAEKFECRAVALTWTTCNIPGDMAES